ncbi:uncharacterized protein [Maniola hyperantus]|uniref:uncharacterized protein n=1 Tax=Aphantopus hyperantus TaxID=2795564 RepID=UPI00156A31EE|nr:uncharacterized protein LOC117989588 [Maniola hyperantus]
MVSRIVCIMTIAGLASGAVWQGARLPEKPREHAHKQGCYVEEIDDVIPFGGIVTPLGGCYRIECTHYRVEYASCGVVSTDSANCFITDTDVSRPYPHCCPDIRCEEDNYLYK